MIRNYAAFPGFRYRASRVTLGESDTSPRRFSRQMISGKIAKDSGERIVVAPRYVVTRFSSDVTAVQDEYVAQALSFIRRPCGRWDRNRRRRSTPSNCHADHSTDALPTRCSALLMKNCNELDSNECVACWQNQNCRSIRSPNCRDFRAAQYLCNCFKPRAWHDPARLSELRGTAACV